MSKIFDLWEKYYLESLAISFLLALFYVLSIQSSFLYWSILQYQNIQADPFDGTLFPIAFVPDPFVVSYEERKWNFVDIETSKFIKIPKYDPKIFGQDPSNFSQSSQEYKDIMTQRIVYTVPYMGTYEMDYQEYVGSHLWVDIVVPKGTPVQNIANGVVVWVWEQSSGFWKYVQVRLNNMTLENGEKKDLYVLYAHLDTIRVEAGNKIKKWEIIGTVWDTGTATTAHLHFQIDLENAPFTPFWPFTSAQMREAWVSFFWWVNIWLWREDALLYTIHPLRFVQNNLSNLWVVVLETPRVELLWNNILDQIEETVLAQETPLVLENWEEWVVDNTSSQQEIQETLVEEKSENIQEEIIQNEILLLTTESQFELVDSIAIKELVTPWENIPQKNEEEKSENIQEETILPSTWFYDISEDYEYRNILEYFHNKQIVQWFQDKTFRPNNTLTRIEATKIMFLAFDKNPIEWQDSQFADIMTRSWENTYVNLGLELGIFSRENNNFFPLREMSKSEALKSILLLSWINLDNYETLYNIQDMNSQDWNYKYIVYALDNNLIQLENGMAYPNQALTREEFMVLLYNILQKK